MQFFWKYKFNLLLYLCLIVKKLLHLIISSNILSNVFAQKVFRIQLFYIVGVKFNTIHYSDLLVTYCTWELYAFTHIPVFFVFPDYFENNWEFIFTLYKFLKLKIEPFLQVLKVTLTHKKNTHHCKINTYTAVYINRSTVLYSESKSVEHVQDIKNKISKQQTFCYTFELVQWGPLSF